MIIKKLSAMPYAQAHVEIDEFTHNIYLFSYTTCVAAIENAKDGAWLKVYGLYSATTRRHLGAFAREYIEFPNGERGDYQFMKMVYNQAIEYNLDTGEIIDLAELFPDYYTRKG